MLTKSDPTYVSRPQQSGSDQLVRGWLDGDGNVTKGAFFGRWSARNIVTPFAASPLRRRM